MEVDTVDVKVECDSLDVKEECVDEEDPLRTDVACAATEGKFSLGGNT